MGSCAIQEKIELVQQIALAALVQFCELVQFFPNCTGAHLISLYNYIGLLFLPVQFAPNCTRAIRTFKL